MKYFLNETLANELKAQTMIKKKVTTQRMVETLINDLMDMAKFDNDKFQFDEDYFCLITTIYEAI